MNNISESLHCRNKVSLRAANSLNSDTKEINEYVLVVPSAGLTAFFPFNGSINDAGPKKLVSVIPLLTTVIDLENGVDRKGVKGNVVSLNNTGGFIVENNYIGSSDGPFNFKTGDFSISCWVNLTVRKVAMVFQSHLGGVTPLLYELPDPCAWLRLNQNAERRVQFNLEDQFHPDDPNLENLDGKWHHIVIVREGLNRKIYFDNERWDKPEPDAVLIDIYGIGPFSFGMQNGVNGFSNFYDGMLDDFIVYKKALTDAEVKALFEL